MDQDLKAIQDETVRKAEEAIEKFNNPENSQEGGAQALAGFATGSIWSMVIPIVLEAVQKMITDALQSGGGKQKQPNA